MKTRTVVPAAIIAALFLAASGFMAAEQMQFRGRMFTGNMAFPVANVKIICDSLSKPDDLAEIIIARNTGGPEAMNERMAKFNVGNIQFIGGRGLRIDLHMAFEKKTEKGLQLFLVGRSQKADPNASRTFLDNTYVLVLQLDLDEKFNGEAKIMEDAVVRFSAAGDFKVESYRTTPKMLVNIQKQ